jgi:hypothetical protein
MPGTSCRSQIDPVGAGFVKSILVAGWALALSVNMSISSARKTTDIRPIVRLYETGRYFELRDALMPLKDDPSVDLEFFRGAVDQVFNRLDTAVPRLRGFLAATERGPARMLAKEAWVLLADAFRRLGRYREAADAFRSVLDRFGPVLDDDERASYRNQADSWSSLAGIPPQSVEFTADTVIRMTKRHFPVSVGPRTFFAGYDTGANMSVLYKSIADELGIAIYGPAVRVQTGTGRWIEGRTGVLPELHLGALVVRNIIVLVLPDEFFRSAKARLGVDRRGLLGAPVLEGFREFTETAAGELLIPARPRPRSLENMCFSGFMPVVEAFHRGARLDLCLDTGAAATSLFPPFYRRYRGEIDARTRLRLSLVEGVGKPRAVPVRVLDEFAFHAGGQDLAIRKVMVQTLATHADSRYFYGILGVDIMSQCSQMTLNFVSMSFILR